jgi:carbamoyl-phosphate synthase large subunit
MEKVLKSLEEGLNFAKEFGYPIKLSPHFTLHRVGLGTANNDDEMVSLLRKALALSPINEVTAKKLLHTALF